MDGRNQFIQISVLDRLVEKGVDGFFSGRVNDVGFVRNVVLRDVEHLLNTRRSLFVPGDGFPYLKGSICVYGIEDYLSRNPRNPEVQKALKKGIEDTIARFEPRLLDVSVQLNTRESGAHHLCFNVRATLFADPVLEPIYFDTWFSVNRGEYRVDDKNHSLEKR